MKKKIFLLVIMLVAFLSVKEVNAAEYHDKTLKNVNDEIYCNYFRGVFSVKDNKAYRFNKSDCPSGSTKIIAELIDGKISNDELIDGENIYLYTFAYDAAHQDWLIAFDGPVIGEASTLSFLVMRKGDILKKGTLFAACNIVVEDKTSEIFYADKDYVVKDAYGSQYNTYYILESVDDEPVTPDEPEPEEPTVQESYKLDLNCLSDKDGSHHCELYYNRVSSESNESNFEVKFKVQAKNIKGQITINDETEELENDKEYTVNGECSYADCKVLLAKFNTKDINKNSSSSMEIEPVSLRIDGEDKPINIENTKCEYSKAILNPKTSNHVLLVVSIILFVLIGTYIVLKKKNLLTKV